MGSSRVGSNPTRSVIFKNYDNVDKIDHLHRVTTSFPWTGRHCAAMAEWLRRLTRNQMGSSRVGSNPTRSVGLAQILERLQHHQKWSALSGNRTPVSRVAGENSTTEPTMLWRYNPPGTGPYVDLPRRCLIHAENWPRWGSNPQSSDSKSDALSIGPRGRCKKWNIIVL